MDYIYTKFDNMEIFSLTKESGADGFRVIEIGHGKQIPNRGGKCSATSWHLHFVVSGSGRIDSVPIFAGEGFIMPFKQVYLEEAGGEGLEQYWINFTGDGADRLFYEVGISPRFKFEKNLPRIRELFFAVFDDPTPDRFAMLGLLFTLCGLIRGQGQANSARTGAELHIRTAEEFVRRSYAGELSVKMIADECRVSPKYLSRIYREIRGTTLVSFITNTRLEAARRLLERSDGAGGGSVSQIAFAVGYSDPLYFSKAFRRRFGVPPGEWRKNARGTY